MLLEDIEQHGGEEPYGSNPFLAVRLRNLRLQLEEVQLAIDEAYGAYRSELNTRLR